MKKGFLIMVVVVCFVYVSGLHLEKTRKTSIHEGNNLDNEQIKICKFPTPHFESETIANIGKGYGLSIADVDCDGKPDILLADVWDFVWFRNGDWKRFVLASRVDGQGAMSIDARDVTGDGKVEIAVCTRGPASSVYFLKRPEDPTQIWDHVRIPSEPEQHRIQWARDYTGRDFLISVPNLGRKNHLRHSNLNQDDYVKVYAYPYTLEPDENYQGILLLESMRDMHAFTVIPSDLDGPDRLIFIGMEGIEFMSDSFTQAWQKRGPQLLSGMTPPNQRPDHSWHSGLGEISEGRIAEKIFLATIEPKHGTNLVIYKGNKENKFGDHRQVLDNSLINGHTLQCTDILDLGYDQILAGWWGSGAEQKDYGIRLYIPLDMELINWRTFTIDEGTIACQSMKIADLNNDGLPDIIAAGWDTKNLIILWNRTEPFLQGNLISHWDFDELSGNQLNDLSGNNHHGRIFGNPQRVSGIAGNALRFITNDDFIEFNSPLIPEQNFTISLWINCDDIEKQFFLGQYLYAHPKRLDLAVREGRVRIQIDSIVDSPKLIKPYYWHHVAYTRHGSSLKIYLDGQLITQTRLSTPVIQTENLILGKIIVPNQNTFRFTGIMDEVKIWDTALPYSVIKKEYLNFSPYL